MGLDVCTDSCVQQNCIGKMFILTPAKSSFEKARGMCLALGGDIVQEVLGEQGTKYHSQIRAITQAAANSGLGDIWVGLTDTYEEGKWRFWASGDDFNDSAAAYTWQDKTSGTSFNCAIVNSSNQYLYDQSCTDSYYALCEIESNLC